MRTRDRLSSWCRSCHNRTRRVVPRYVHLDGAIVPNPGDPNPGEALYFAADGRDLVTSPLESIERPAKALVEAYPEPPPLRRSK